MTDRAERIARARRLRPEIPKVLSELGLKARRSGREWRTHCPEPTHAARSRKRDSGSWQINEQGQHHCFGCGFGGDLFHLVATVRDRGLIDAAEWLIERFGDELDPETEVVSVERLKVRPEPILELPESEPLWGPTPKSVDAEAAIRYLRGRSVDGDAIERYSIRAVSARSRVRYRGRLIVPIVVEGRLVDFVARLYVEARDGSPKALSGRRIDGARKELALWNYDCLDRRASTVYVTEGVWGAMAIIRAGFPNVVASCGSVWSSERTELLRWWDRIVLIPDGDVAGRTMIDRCSGLRFRHTVQALDLPTGAQPDSIEPSYLATLLGDDKNLRKIEYIGDFESFTCIWSPDRERLKV